MPNSPVSPIGVSTPWKASDSAFSYPPCKRRSLASDSVLRTREVVSYIAKITLRGPLQMPSSSHTNGDHSPPSAAPQPPPPRVKQSRPHSPVPSSSGQQQQSQSEARPPPPKRARKAINCEPCRNSKLKCDRCVQTQHRLSFPARPLAALARLRAPPRISALANDISSLSSDLQKPPLLVLRAQRCVLPAPSADASLTRSRVGTTSLCYQGQDADPSLRGVLDQQYVSTLPCSPSLFCGSLSSPSSSSTSGGLLTLRPSSLASDTR